MSAFRALHLSDLHIGSTFLPPEELACKIADDIAQNGLTGIRCVLVTGDIFNGPSGYTPELVKTAAGFFLTLMDQLNQDQGDLPLDKNDFIFVPGNHDLLWSEDTDKQWSKYRAFLEQFYGRPPASYDPQDFSVVREYPEARIAFLGFNSCGLEKCRPYNDGYAFCENLPDSSFDAAGIDKAALMGLLEKSNQEKYEDYGEIPATQLSSMRRRTSHLVDYTPVAMFHHHFYLFPDIAGKVGDADVVRNHAALVRSLRTMGVKTVLHGHKHFDLERPFINEDYYDTTDSIIDVFAGGSAGSKGLQQHTFSVLDFFPKQDTVKLIQKKFVYREDYLEPIKTKKIPPQSREAKLIRLMDQLKDQDHTVSEQFSVAAMASQRLFTVSSGVIGWLDQALTGFSEVSHYLSEDPLCLRFLLFSVYARTLHGLVRHSPEGERKFEGAAEIFDKLYSTYLMAHVPEGYPELFSKTKLKDVSKFCDQLMEQSTGKRQKQYLAFSMVGIFFSDLYLVMTEYADDFYGQISHKVNIRLEPNQFHVHVPAARIRLYSDADRRSAYVDLWCNDATAHKLAVLFVKEFDLTIGKYKFEDYFKLIGLKLYYLLPKIEKDRSLDALDNYNFEAYIPTLLPLLTGDNIYDSKEVFARELIQNSIDAISVRRAVEKGISAKDRIIRICLSKTADGKPYFEITDHGTGMDRYKIERYFTSIGRSFYSGKDYAELGIDYKPISSFGIGFLSSFMVCQEIDVTTRSFQEDSEGLRLHIPNYEGCFFIEKNDQAEIGTTVRLYLNGATNKKMIEDYIKEVMLDIPYPVRISNGSRKRDLVIDAHSVRKSYKKNMFRFFIPFHEDGTIGRLNWEKDILNADIMEQFPYGLFVFPSASQRTIEDTYFLNSGILIRDGHMKDLFPRYNDSQSLLTLILNPAEHSSLTLVINLPSNWIQMDVSREKIVGFSDWLQSIHGGEAAIKIQAQLVTGLLEQANDLLTYAKDHLVNVKEQYVKSFLNLISCFTDPLPEIFINQCAARICSALVKLDQDKIVCSLVRGSRESSLEAKNFNGDYVKRFKQLVTKFPQKLLNTKNAGGGITIHSSLSGRTGSDFYIGQPQPFGSSHLESSYLTVMKNSFILMCAELIVTYLKGSTSSIPAWQHTELLSSIEMSLLSKFTISDVENGRAELSIGYDEILKFVDVCIAQSEKESENKYY